MTDELEAREEDVLENAGGEEARCVERGTRSIPSADGGGLFSTTGGRPEAEGLGTGCNTGLLLLPMFNDDEGSVGAAVKAVLAGAG